MIWTRRSATAAGGWHEDSTSQNIISVQRDGPDLVNPARATDIVAVDARVIELLRAMHALEMYGEMVFALMLENGGPLSSSQRCKIEACRLLGVDMAEMISNHITLELGLALAPSDPPALTPAQHAAIHEQDWRRRMIAVEVVAAGVISPFRELKTLYADRQPKLCNTLLAHALIIRDFAHHEVEGDTELSLGGVISMLRDETMVALSHFPT